MSSQSIYPLALAPYEIMKIVVLFLHALQSGWVTVDKHPMGKSDGFRNRIKQVQLRTYRTLFVENHQKVNIRVGLMCSHRSRSKKPHLSKPVTEHPSVALNRIGDCGSYGPLRRNAALLKSGGAAISDAILRMR